MLTLRAAVLATFVAISFGTLVLGCAKPEPPIEGRIMMGMKQLVGREAGFYQPGQGLKMTAVPMLSIEAGGQIGTYNLETSDSTEYEYVGKADQFTITNADKRSEFDIGIIGRRVRLAGQVDGESFRATRIKILTLE